jgi:hypothetical protein
MPADRLLVKTLAAKRTVQKGIRQSVDEVRGILGEVLSKIAAENQPPPDSPEASPYEPPTCTSSDWS